MVIRKPHVARLFERYIKTPWCASLAMSVALIGTMPTWHHAEEYASLSPSSGKGLPSSLIMPQPIENATFKPLMVDLHPQDQVLPRLLNGEDVKRYRSILEAQKAGEWDKADAIISTLKNRILLGHVLAKRYLSADYKSSPAELAEWLAQYSDHPQAAHIYQLALSKKPSLKDQLPAIQRQAMLDGYGDDNGLNGKDNASSYTQTWRMGLAAWKAGRMEEAAKLFSGIARQQDKISPWTYSAAAYWSYRAYNNLGNKAEARRYLELAAENPRSFYGIIARKHLHRPLDLQVTPVGLTETDILEMIGDPAIRRAIALTQAGMYEQADKELRTHYPQVDRSEKPRLLALAHALNLPSVQITMAVRMRNEQHSLDFARYPIPDWQPEGGFTVDPALMFALMRQESGFRISAVSPVGALGLMQLMPETARLMEKRIAQNGTAVRSNASITEPVMNMTLGQNYLHHLMDSKLVEGNLFYLLAAYNAGPGRLQEWKRTLDYNNDPLLFVESIPYSQTRHYVMQVMANYWIYSELTGTANYSVHALLQGHWPWYQPYAAASTTLASRTAG